jgi:hypothetical protein
MTLQDIYKLAEQWREHDAKRYAVEFYNKVIIDLIDRKQWAKNRYWYKKDYTDGLINWLNARYPAVLVTKFVINMIENIK